MASRILSSWSRIAVRSSGPARSAARPATSTSRILRISRSSHNVLGCTRRSRPRVSRTARELPPLTTAPRPCSMLMRPRASSRFKASLTTVLLTPRCAHSSRSGGRRSPGSSPSDITISSNWSAARSLSLVRRDCSITLEHCHTNRDVCQTASIFGPPCSLRPLAVGSRCGPWALILPPARFHNAAVDRLHREDQEVDVPRQGHQCLTAEDGDGYRGQPDRHVEQVALDLLARHRKLVCAESQRAAQRVRPQVHQHEHELNSDESSAVYEQQERNLGRFYYFVLGKAEQLVHPQGKDELQWVDVEEHQEEQHRVQPQGREVPQAVAPEELVVLVPHEEEQGEADREREEAPHVHEKLVEGLGNLQRNHKERDREGEDGVGESLHTRDILPTPAEAFLANPPLHQRFAHHCPFTPARRQPVSTRLGHHDKGATLGRTGSHLDGRRSHHP